MNWSKGLPKYLIREIERNDFHSGLKADFIIQKQQFNSCIRNKDYKQARQFLHNIDKLLTDLIKLNELE